jgi:hypothetical protein
MRDPFPEAGAALSGAAFALKPREYIGTCGPEF